MSDNLYNALFESYQRMSAPKELITESEIREAFPKYSDEEVSNAKAMCEGYLKFEEMILGSSTEVLLERFAGDDQAMVPSNKPFDPEATIGKPEVPAAPAAKAAPAKKPGMWDKIKGAASGAKDAVVKAKEFAKKVKDIYTQLPKKKILILLAAGAVIGIVASAFPMVGAVAKVAFGGFNIFKGAKGFWTEFKKDSKDRSNVKAVLSVLQLGLGIFSAISGASEIVNQITNLKQQVVAQASQAAPADAPAQAPAAPEAPAAAPEAPAAPVAPDLSKYTSYGASKAAEMQGDIQSAITGQNPSEAFKQLMNPFAEKIGAGVQAGKITPDQAEAILKGFAEKFADNNGGVSAESMFKKLLSLAKIK
jgi:hypothetical protein